DDFSLQVFKVVLVEVKATLERPIRHPPIAPQQVQHLGQDLVKRHTHPSQLNVTADTQLAYTALTLGADRTVEWQCNEECPCSLCLGYRRLPFRDLCRAERGLNTLVSGMRTGTGIGGQLRQHVHVLQASIAEALVQTTIRTAFGACHAVWEGGDFQL